MTTPLRLFVLFFLLFFLPVWSVATGSKVMVFEPRHVAAEDILPSLRTLLGPDARVAVVHNRLIVQGSPEDLKGIAEALKKIDQPRKTLVIFLRQASHPTGASISSGARPAKTVLRTGHPGKDQEQRLHVAHGGQGFIRVGEEIPYTAAMTAIGGRDPAFSRSSDYKSIATGFRIRPTLVQSGVDLEITPFQEQTTGLHDPAQPPRTFFQSASTRLVIPLNQWHEVAASATGTGTETGKNPASRWTTGPAHQRNRIWIMVRESGAEPAAKDSPPSPGKIH